MKRQKSQSLTSSLVQSRTLLASNWQHQAVVNYQEKPFSLSILVSTGSALFVEKIMQIPLRNHGSCVTFVKSGVTRPVPTMGVIVTVIISVTFVNFVLDIPFKRTVYLLSYPAMKGTYFFKPCFVIGVWKSPYCMGYFRTPV